jgi:GNAT superfamily N-acetyltransferase
VGTAVGTARGLTPAFRLCQTPVVATKGGGALSRTEIPLEIHPVTSDRWSDMVELFERPGPRGGRPVTDGCWCMYWRERSGDRDTNKQAMAGIVASGRQPGLLAYRDGEPVGWVAVAPRAEHAQLLRSPSYKPVDDDEGVFAITCFYVASSAKRQGVATQLLTAAVEDALARGAAAIEAYPKGPADYMGSVEQFRRAGFRRVRQAGPRVVMRYAR